MYPNQIPGEPDDREVPMFWMFVMLVMVLILELVILWRVW